MIDRKGGLIEEKVRRVSQRTQSIQSLDYKSILLVIGIKPHFSRAPTIITVIFKKPNFPWMKINTAGRSFQRVIQCKWKIERIKIILVMEKNWVKKVEK